MDFPCTQRLVSDESNTSFDCSVDETKHLVATLVVKEQNEIKEAEHFIYTGENYLGRGVGDILIPEGLSLSRKHACIEAEKETAFLFDCGSSNGTKIGNLKLKPNVRYQLQNNSIVTFGNIECIYRENTPIMPEDKFFSTPKSTTNVLANETPEFALKDTKGEEEISQEIPETPLQDESLLSNFSLSGNQKTLNELNNSQSNDEMLQPKKLVIISDSDDTDLDDEPEVSDNEMSGNVIPALSPTTPKPMFSESPAELSDVDNTENSTLPQKNDTDNVGPSPKQQNIPQQQCSQKKKMITIRLFQIQNPGGEPPVQSSSIAASPPPDALPERSSKIVPGADVCFEEEDESDESGGCEISDEESGSLMVSLGSEMINSEQNKEEGGEVGEQHTKKDASVSEEGSCLEELDSSNAEKSSNMELVDNKIQNENVAMDNENKQSTIKLIQTVEKTDVLLNEQSCTAGSSGGKNKVFETKPMHTCLTKNMKDVPYNRHSDDDELAYMNCSIFVDSDCSSVNSNNNDDNYQKKLDDAEESKFEDGSGEVLADETLSPESDATREDVLESDIKYVPESQALETNESSSTENDSVFDGSSTDASQHTLSDIKNPSTLADKVILDSDVDPSKIDESVVGENADEKKEDENVSGRDGNISDVNSEQGNVDKNITDMDLSLDESNNDRTSEKIESTEHIESGRPVSNMDAAEHSISCSSITEEHKPTNSLEASSSLPDDVDKSLANIEILDQNENATENSNDDVIMPKEGDSNTRCTGLRIENENVKLQPLIDQVESNENIAKHPNTDLSERERILKLLPTLDDSMAICDSFSSDDAMIIDEDASLLATDYELADTQPYCPEPPPKKVSKKSSNKHFTSGSSTPSRKYTEECDSKNATSSGIGNNTVHLVDNEIINDEELKDLIPTENLNEIQINNEALEKNSEITELDNDIPIANAKQAAGSAKDIIPAEINNSDNKEIQSSIVPKKDDVCLISSNEEFSPNESSDNAGMKLLSNSGADKNNNKSTQSKDTENKTAPENSNNKELVAIFDNSDDSEAFMGFANSENSKNRIKTRSKVSQRLQVGSNGGKGVSLSKQPRKSARDPPNSKKDEKSPENTSSMRLRKISSPKTTKTRKRTQTKKKEKTNLTAESKPVKSRDAKVTGSSQEIDSDGPNTRRSLRSHVSKTAQNKRKLFDSDLEVLETETFSPIESRRSRREARSTSKNKVAQHEKKTVALKKEILTPEKAKKLETSFTQKTGISIREVKIEIDDCDSQSPTRNTRCRRSLIEKAPLIKIESTDSKKSLRKRKVHSHGKDGAPQKKCKNESDADVSYTFRERKVKPKVMFTGFLDKDAEKIIVKLGGEVTEDLKQCTHLVSKDICRRLKFFCALVRGAHILTPDWVYQSKSAQSFLPEEQFQLAENWNRLESAKSRRKSLQSPTCPSEIEKQYNFSLKESLLQARSHRHLLFHGLLIHVTPSVKPSPAQLYDIITCGDGKPFKKLPKTINAAWPKDLIVVSCVDDKKTCASAMKAGIRIVTNEFILTGILQQKLLYNHSLFT